MNDVIHTANKAAKIHSESVNCKKVGHLYMLYWQQAFNIKKKTVGGSKKEKEKEKPSLSGEKGTQQNLKALIECKYDMSEYIEKHVKSKTKKKKDKTCGKKVKYKELGERRLKGIGVVPNIINLDFINREVCSLIITDTLKRINGYDVSGEKKLIHLQLYRNLLIWRTT